MQSSEDNVVIYQIKIDNKTGGARESKAKNQLQYLHIPHVLPSGQERKREVPSVAREGKHRNPGWNPQLMATTS